MPRALLVVLAAVVLVAVAVALWFGLRRSTPADETTGRDRPHETVRVDVSELPVDSPDLAVGRAAVRGAIQDGFTSWLVVLTCAEAAGCVGELAVELRYHTGSAPGTLVLAGHFDTPDGGELRFEGLQEPSTPIESVDRVSLEVRFRGDVGELIDGVID